MPTLLITHDACLAHDTGENHPENPGRLRAILAALEAPEFASLVRREAPVAEIATLELAHPPDYVARTLDAIPREGLRALDGDTLVCPGSHEAALRAVGAVVAAVDAVASGEARNAFCAVRPPGHHAEPSRAMGFCLFNNVAIGALHGRRAHGFRRVAVVDFDVHHGNGTQAMFWSDAELFYASTHQSPAYPGTGRRDERGVGNIVNVPLSPHAGSDEFRAAMSDTVLPALDEFAPDLVLISAGFDGHRDDPLADLNLTESDYAWITGEVKALAETHCAGRLVSTLEGGYNPDALAASCAAHLRALMSA